MCSTAVPFCSAKTLLHCGQLLKGCIHEAVQLVVHIDPRLTAALPAASSAMEIDARMCRYHSYSPTTSRIVPLIGWCQLKLPERAAGFFVRPSIYEKRTLMKVRLAATRYISHAPHLASPTASPRISMRLGIRKRKTKMPSYKTARTLAGPSHNEPRDGREKQKAPTPVEDEPRER